MGMTRKRKFDMNKDYMLIFNRRKYVREQLEAQETFKNVYAGYIADPYTSPEKRQESVYRLIQVGAVKTTLESELQFLEQL
jgi:hypothetical protein